MNTALAVRILFNVVQACGRRSLTRITWRDPPPSPSDVLKRIQQLNAEERGGRIDFTDFHLDEYQGRIVVAEAFEKNARTSDAAVCFFLGGYLTRFISGLLSQILIVKETTCTAMGESKCVFEVSSSS